MATYAKYENKQEILIMQNKQNMLNLQAKPAKIVLPK